MKRIDLHCHSIYSEHPSEWFLQKLGAKESYTDPFKVYNEAKRSGMDYVTITDHNKIDGALLLKERYPEDVIIGVEATTYFPEDNCKIHILIFGLTREQFEQINLIRTNIYNLRDYIKRENLAYSVAHASYSVNNKLRQDHLEKLVLLFDHFEIINGGRNIESNLGWERFLLHLNKDIIDKLYREHRIEPFSEESWLKGVTAGSDDHGGLFIGKTYTEAESESPEELLEALREKKTEISGRHSNYHTLAFTVYKIAYDFTKEKNLESKNKNLLSVISDNLFESNRFNLKQRFKLKKMKGKADKKGDQLKQNLADLVVMLQQNRESDLENKLELVYNQVSHIADSFFKVFLSSLEEDLKELSFVKIIRNLSSSLPGIFLLLPFFSSLKHMHQNNALLKGLYRKYDVAESTKSTKTLWFTDTINDLNGVSVTLKLMGQTACDKGYDMRIVSSVNESEITSDFPDNYLNLPYIYEFRLPYYENYKLKIPSILRALKIIDDYKPDQIIISTPGPVGLLALLAAKLLNIHCIGIYHTDFASETMHIVTDESASGIVLGYEKWFFNQMDEIRAPTNEYLQILEERAVRAKKMGLLKRGIEPDKFFPQLERKKFVRDLFYPEELTLLYTGRVSKDKSLKILADVYKKLIDNGYRINLLIVGNGPYYNELKTELEGYQGALFTGALPRNSLPKFYNAADYLVFPSVTDTFGMVILEAQACGLPVIVSNYGGPKEIIIPEETGFVVKEQSRECWLENIEHAIKIHKTDHKRYLSMRDRSHKLVSKNSDWDTVLSDLIGEREVG